MRRLANFMADGRTSASLLLRAVAHRLSGRRRATALGMVVPQLHLVGGCEHQSVALCQALNRSQRPALLLLAGGMPSPDTEWADAPLRRYEQTRWGRSSYAVLALSLADLVAQHNLAVLLCTALVRENLPALVVGRLLGLPVVLRHDTVGRLTKLTHGALLDRLAAWLSKRATNHIALSEATVDELRSLGIPPRRISYLPNGVNTSHFRPPTAAERSEARAKAGLEAEVDVLLYVGRCVARKRLDVVAEAFLELAPRRDDISLWIVGDGPSRAEIEPRLSALGDRVVWWGEQGDVRRFMWAADLFVMASEREGMPNTVLEALACGLPVVGAAAGGTSDIVSHGGGRLVPVGEASALAEAVSDLLSNRPQLEDLRHEARTVATVHFEQGAAVERLAALLNRLGAWPG